MATYRGSDADRTRALYAEISALGPAGVVAMNLLRAQKASERAKLYRGRANKGQAYEKKQWSMGNACLALQQHGEAIGIVWGWGVDASQPVHSHVLYVDCPTGQVSFHSGFRGVGPDYPGEWDGVAGMGPQRVVTWCANLLDAQLPCKNGQPYVAADGSCLRCGADQGVACRDSDPERRRQNGGVAPP